MKNHPIVILMLSLYSISSFSFTTTTKVSFSQEESIHNIKEATLLVKAVEDELLSNVWHQGDSKFLFGASGILSISNTYQNELESRIWNLEYNDTSVLLRITDTRCNEIVYKIEKTGERFKWINVNTNLPIKMNSTPLKLGTEVLKTQKSLVGTWSSSIFPTTVIEDIENLEDKSVISADFKYVLREDGSFTKIIYINQKQYSLSKGLWQVSDNAETLILHFQKKDCSYTTSTAEIKLLSMDELVLGQSLATSDLEKQLCNAKKTFFYNKQ